MSCLFLRQSTAYVVSFGPFLDKTDGVTLEIGLVSAIDHATTGILLSKNGGALTIRSQAVTASTYDAYGNYLVTLSTTDTNTIGKMRAQFSEAATCLPVWQDFMVIDEAVYDALFGTVALATTTNISAGTITTVTNLTNLPAAAALEATSQSILTDTAEIGAAGAGLTALATQASVNTIDDFLDTEIVAIKTQTDKFTFTVAGVVDANVQRVNDVAIVGDGSVTPFNV